MARMQRLHRRTSVLIVSAALALSACGGTSTTLSLDAPAPAAPAETPVAEQVSTISITAVTTVGDEIDLVPANQETLLWFWAPW